VTDARPAPGPSCGRRGVHHLGRDIAVANTGLDVLLTTISATARATTACTTTRLTPDEARAIGWALIEAAGFLEAGAEQPGG
jgi:hypothetical protein